MIPALVLCVVAAVLAPTLVRRWGTRGILALALVPATLFAGALAQFPWSPGQVRVAGFPWVPSLGVEASFLLDGLSYVFTLLITGIGTLIVIYAAGYTGGKAGSGRLLGWLLFFTAAMLGLVWSDNLITLFVFWELTSVASFMLIGWKHEDAASRTSARRALAVTGAGGLVLLAGLILLALIGRDAGLGPVEALTLSRLLVLDAIPQHALYPFALACILVGAFTKSAQVPAHFWLPGAMTAPTPVSAFLHSATMVKAGIYLLARMHPALGGTPAWTWTLVGVGGITMLTAAVLCLGQRDLKRILAYSTVSVLGILTLLLGLGTEYAIKAAVVFLVAHALYKASLFMVAGNVDLATGTRDVTRLGGLGGPLRWTAAAALVAALSKAGAPPLFGFMGKELLYKAKLAPDLTSSVLLFGAFLTNVLLVAMALVVAIVPFRGAPTEATREARALPATTVVGPVVLALLGVFIGIFPSIFDRGLGSAMATSIAGTPIEMKLQLWYGMNPEALAVVAVSALTLAAGFAVFLSLRRRMHLPERLVTWLGQHGPERGFDALLDGAMSAGRWLVTILLRGGLRGAILAMLTVFLVMTAPPLLRGRPAPGGGPEWMAMETMLVLLIVGGGLAALRYRTPLASLASIGASGLGMALLFAAFGAPDLAMTQIMVEVLALIVLLLVLRQVPDPATDPGRLPRVGRTVAAVAVGFVVAILSASATDTGAVADTAAYYLEESYPSALGRNVVNTILVDFRALDTLGEVLVIAAAGLGVMILLAGAGRRSGQLESDRLDPDRDVAGTPGRRP